MLSVILSSNITFAEAKTVSPSIELQDFRWSKSPLKVLVEISEWSTYDYGVAVRGALDNWVKSIQNYTQTYSNMTVKFNYLFYVSNANSTSSYDILISFSENEFDNNIVGITTYTWDPKTHEPISPVLINITTYSATADGLFVRNVAMHELGHALGLGHANSPDTTNGPELMYPTSSLKQTVYPSTLDTYGLLMLHNGNFERTIQLPLNIPYIMLAEGNIPPQDQTYLEIPQNQTYLEIILYLPFNEPEAFFYNPQGILYNPMLLLVPSILWMAIALILGLIFHSETKATIISIGIFIFACYIAMVNIDLFSLGPKIVLVLPPIAIGASIGRFISSKIARRKIETVNMESGN